jgi:hypothetical protein
MRMSVSTTKAATRNDCSRGSHRAKAGDDTRGWSALNANGAQARHGGEGSIHCV